MPKRPTVKRGPASAYAGPGETTVEFFDTSSQAGGLINLRSVTTANGQRRLLVSLYRLDPGVKVFVERRRP